MCLSGGLSVAIPLSGLLPLFIFPFPSPAVHPLAPLSSWPPLLTLAASLEERSEGAPEGQGQEALGLESGQGVGEVPDPSYSPSLAPWLSPG